MTREEELSLMRLVRFLIRLPEINKHIMNQPLTARDDLFNDEATIDMAIDRMENNG